jgi:hypothetical protein
MQSMGMRRSPKKNILLHTIGANEMSQITKDEVDTDRGSSDMSNRW